MLGEIGRRIGGIVRSFRIQTLEAQLTAVLFTVGLFSGIVCATVLYRSSVDALTQNAIDLNYSKTTQLARILSDQFDELSQVAFSIATSELTAQVIEQGRPADYASVTIFSEHIDLLHMLALRNTLAV
ncbi:MAG TPA: hypothetical protein PKE04_09995 [Clostridia bacterium]|nr:hypothetical protein [Clostridia bacterium]